MAILSALNELNKRTAKSVVRVLKKMVTDKVDFNGQSYSELKNPRAGRSADSRLNDSGKFANGWVVADYANAKGFAIRTNAQVHSGNVTFNDIVAYNDKNSSRVNKHIKIPPELTPSREEQIENTEWFRRYLDELTEVIDKESGDVAKVVHITI